MIDRPVRHDLALWIARLGDREVKAFDIWQLQEAGFPDSEDPAVRTIAEQIVQEWTSIHRLTIRCREDGQPFPGNSDCGRMLTRCVAFLQSEFEYRWPPKPEPSSLEELARVVRRAAPPGTGSALLVIVLVVGGWRWFAGQLNILVILACILFALFLMGLHKWLPKEHPNYDAPKWQEFCRHGDFDVWPFLRREDWEAVAEFKGC